MGASTGASGTLWSKWSPEKEKSKLVSRKRKMPEKIRMEETYPEATGLCFFGRGMQSSAFSWSGLVQAGA
jgi:hypothetical protein